MTRFQIGDRVRQRAAGADLPILHAQARDALEKAGGKLPATALTSQYGRGIVNELRRHYAVRICEWVKSPAGRWVSVIELGRGIDAHRPTKGDV